MSLLEELSSDPHDIVQISRKYPEKVKKEYKPAYTTGNEQVGEREIHQTLNFRYKEKLQVRGSKFLDHFIYFIQKKKLWYMGIPK